VGSVITEKRVLDMPLNGRNFMQLTLLTGGIDEGGTSNAKGGILNKGFAPSAAGMPAAENNYLLDGRTTPKHFLRPTIFLRAWIRYRSFASRSANTRRNTERAAARLST